ncbi:MAG: Uncharacterised protein [Cellulomonadaceae bacterium TMED98]|nr:MAG: Uncharacterised protein [Cellulomonadaceae bacterium TMED98]
MSVNIGTSRHDTTPFASNALIRPASRGSNRQIICPGVIRPTSVMASTTVSSAVSLVASTTTSDLSVVSLMSCTGTSGNKASTWSARSSGGTLLATTLCPAARSAWARATPRGSSPITPTESLGVVIGFLPLGQEPQQPAWSTAREIPRPPSGKTRPSVSHRALGRYGSPSHPSR